MVDSIFLNIAGFNIRVNFYQTQWQLLFKTKKKEIRKYWGGFIVNKTPKKIDFQIDFVERILLETIVKKNHKRHYIGFFEEKPGKKMTTYYQISFIHFQLILRQIITDLLRDRGFIIHGSASNINGRAFLFVGQSGAGKSTTMKLLNSQHPSLADDTVIIKKESNQYYLYQTPLIEKEDWVKKTEARYELKSVFFIKKAKFFKTEKLVDKKQILFKLSKQFFTNENKDMMKKAKTLFNFVYSFDNFHYLYLKKSKKEMIKFINSL